MSLITLHHQNIDPVSWQEDAACSFNIDDQVDIWRVNVSSNLSALENMPGVLNAAEAVRASRYFRDADRNRFTVSRTALRRILGRYLNQPAEVIEFEKGENDKPFIKSNLIHFNLSDSADWILIAVAKSEIGIDVEYIKPGFDYNGIINSNFNPSEIAYIKAENSLNRFFELWTRKEAILKATGTGLTEHLKAITALDGTQIIEGHLLNSSINWKLSTFDLTKDYPSTIATGVNIEKCIFYNLKF